ncbi:MAG: hypothetical protein A2934_04045 [Candidatus Sungbacteria bacterium RIFCSPLOWO2_01_FULL_47_10]|uniref:Sodium/calcium exchanger membrane region domain-containing protein n=1 Tax=Candidatus Sungbacteria bacterium RIFCSPLOWO2_01_FULL_47_10 TaxID=1802276 RepID=A0A1G2L0W2_9BACT|nr:MAG: hypothetical protein A2934_04045 [Candidatus Sungbacteria bacterium RIFCSPLOWO2_01_FULL_47_10]
MATVIEITILGAALYILIRAGGALVRTMTAMARFLRISEYALSFILMALATSLPELFIGISSAARNAPLLSLGNIIGSNVLNVTLVLGAGVIAAGSLTIGKDAVRGEMGKMFALTFVPAILLFDGELSRGDGALLLLLFVAYLVHLFYSNRVSPPVDGSAGEFGIGEFMRSFLFFFVNIFLVIGSSWFIVYEAERLAAGFGVPLFFIGLFVISFGTTLPELVFNIRSSMSGYGEMSLGNSLGSVIFNISGILGIVAIIQPVHVDDPLRAVSGLVITSILIFLIQLVLLLKGDISRGYGIGLIAISLLFLGIEAFL